MAEQDKFGHERNVVTKVNVPWKIECWFNFKDSSLGIEENVNIHMRLDLNALSDEEKSILCAKALKIMPVVRDLCAPAIKDGKWDLGTLVLHDSDVAAKARAAKDPMSIALGAIGKMTDEQKQKLREELEAA